MRLIAALIMIVSQIALIWVLHEAVEIAVAHPRGLTNPTLHFSLNPDLRDMVFAMSLVAAVSTYCFALVSWIARQLTPSKPDKVATPPATRQPASLRLLNDAIRAGDADGVRKFAKRTAFDRLDDEALSPWELADLYENQAVIEALRSAMVKRAQSSGAPGQRIQIPSSAFALRNPPLSPADRPRS